MIAIRLLPPIVVTLPLFPAIELRSAAATRTRCSIVLYATFWVSLCT